MSAAGALTHELLGRLGVEHGFGLRGFVAPPGLRRPRQVHGRGVVDAARLATEPDPPQFEADAVYSGEAGVGVAVVTADCVPILLADGQAGVVAAVHAGWRGIAVGVIGAAVSAIEQIGAKPERLVAAIGPYIGPCCYEVDEPVLSAFARRFDSLMKSAAHPTRAGHARIDLGAFASAELTTAGLSIDRVGSFDAACTRCDSERFHSYRRDGAKSGRMVHFVRAPSAAATRVQNSNSRPTGEG